MAQGQRAFCWAPVERSVSRVSYLPCVVGASLVRRGFKESRILSAAKPAGAPCNERRRHPFVKFPRLGPCDSDTEARGEVRSFLGPRLRTRQDACARHLQHASRIDHSTPLVYATRARARTRGVDAACYLAGCGRHALAVARCERATMPTRRKTTTREMSTTTLIHHSLASTWLAARSAVALRC